MCTKRNKKSYFLCPAVGCRERRRCEISSSLSKNNFVRFKAKMILQKRNKKLKKKQIKNVNLTELGSCYALTSWRPSRVQRFAIASILLSQFIACDAMKTRGSFIVNTSDDELVNKQRVEKCFHSRASVKCEALDLQNEKKLLSILFSLCRACCIRS